MKVKKLLALALTLAMCIGMLSACGGGNAGSNGGNSGNNGGGSSSNGGGSNSGGGSGDGKVYEFTVVNHDSITSLGEQYLETLLNAIAEESGGRVHCTD